MHPSTNVQSYVVLELIHLLKFDLVEVINISTANTPFNEIFSAICIKHRRRHIVFFVIINKIT